MKSKLRQCTNCLLIKNNQVLLALKKRGFGAGKWNGVGGKCQESESIEEAAIREAQEEIGVTPLGLKRVAVLDFYFPDIPQDQNWNQQVIVFVVKEWQGDPTESEEMSPQWFNIDQIPYSQMWEDDPYWMPQVLAGQKVRGKFTFAGEGKMANFYVSGVVGSKQK
ncbi:MAG: 8-oxo-dGTP diphosphatase [bacterium]|nr:8-oxo-dGTP diphosphatase [bacterium]